MSSLFKQFGTNKTAEVEGVKIQYGLTDAGLPISVTIARFGGDNTPATIDFIERGKAKRQQLGVKELDEMASREILAENTAKTLLKGWENVQDKNGVEIPFTYENAKNLLLELPDFMFDIRAKCDRISTFQTEDDESTVKN